MFSAKQLPMLQIVLFFGGRQSNFCLLCVEMKINFLPQTFSGPIQQWYCTGLHNDRNNLNNDVPARDLNCKTSRSRRVFSDICSSKTIICGAGGIVMMMASSIFLASTSSVDPAIPVAIFHKRQPHSS